MQIIAAKTIYLWEKNMELQAGILFGLCWAY